MPFRAAERSIKPIKRQPMPFSLGFLGQGRTWLLLHNTDEQPEPACNRKRPARLPACRRLRLFPAVQIGKSCASDLGHFGGWVEIYQLLIELLGMRDITLVFFEGGRFKQRFGLLIGAAEQHQTEDTEYKSCGYHGDPFQASLRRDT